MSTILVLCLTDPTAVRHGGTLRNAAMIRAIQHAGIHTEIRFPPEHPGGTTPEGGAVGRLRALKRSLLPMPTQSGAQNPRLAAEVDGSTADAILVSVLSQIIYHRRKPRPLWLDLMDVWSSFAAVEAGNRTGVPALSARLQAAQLRLSERRALRTAAVRTAAGWADVETLRGRGHVVEWLPTPLDDDEFRRIPRTPSAGSTVGFLANFRYWPNVDAYRLLCDQWRHRLAAAGYAIVVAGHGSEDLPPVDGVTVLGPVEHVDDFYARVSATLAPIRLGGGMKVKIIESLSRGVPVIGTPSACEGLPPSIRDRLTTVGENGDELVTLSLGQADVDPAAAFLDPFRFGWFAERVRSHLPNLTVEASA